MGRGQLVAAHHAPALCHQTAILLAPDVAKRGSRSRRHLPRQEGRTWDNAGRVEDVATGSAAGPAAGYLMHHGVGPAGQPLVIHQGRFTGRPSTIEVRPGPDGRLWVGGPAAPVAAGRFHAHLT
jgi:predicted PhzF superfamily epimerase YddE/YHI9